jgi:hypothetical protein
MKQSNTFWKSIFTSVLFLFLFSLALSTVFIQAHNSPLKTFIRQNSDMAFDDWSKYLAKGNWWCDTILLPRLA